MPVCSKISDEEVEEFKKTMYSSKSYEELLKYLGIEIKYCINIGLLMACAIAFKYSAIFIMLCTFIYICISRIYLKQKDRLLIKLALTLLPSIFILIAIFNYNLFQTGTLSKNIVSMKIYLSDLPISWLYAPFDALFFKTTMINSGFIRNLFFNNTFLIATLKTLIVLIFVSIIFILIKNNNSLKLYKLLFLFLSGFLANFLFLFSLTFLFLDRNAIWTPVEDGRYYLPLLPLLFAIVFLLLEKKINIKFFKNSAKKIILVILVFIYLWAVCFFEIYWNKNIKFIRNTSFEVLKEIQYLKENNPLHKIVIFSDEDFHRSSLNFIPAAIFYLEPYNTEWKTLIDGKAIVLLICIPTYRLNHQKSDDNCKSMNYTNSASLFGFDTYREWNNNLIFVKRYD
jgi:hypothetical protein